MITFGIITNKEHHQATEQKFRIETILDSIDKEKIPGVETIIVGDYNTSRAKCISFDETIKPAWITKKKNIITQNASNDIIVYMHDYIILCDNWYKGMLTYGLTDWDIMMNIILNKNERRFRDWCVFKYDGNVGRNGVWEHTTPGKTPYIISPYLPDYNYNKTHNLYISGSYWIAKKYVMIEEPLDENFVWGQPEDIEWSERVLPKYKYVMNTYSTVKLLHQKGRVWKPL